jgi:hypothetical protein
VYDITVDAAATTAMELIPIAIAEVSAPPTNAALARLVTVNQTGLRTFSVYITTGTFTPVNHQFMMIVTGR